jgi:DNA invertase Pin-like site-specific DNA recombinase
VIENDLMPGTGNGKPRMASAFKRRKIVTPSGRTEWRVYRPGFRSVLDDIASGRAAAVMAEDLDRACRDPRDLEDLVDVIREHKANARSLSGSLTLTSGGTDAEHLTARIMVAVANKSSADTARRVAQARQRQAEHGTFGGGGRPYGYARDGMTLVPAEAAEITRAAGAVLAGTSLKAVARDLRDRHVPTVSDAKWCSATIRNILLRPRNAGIAVHHGAETGPASWPAILPEEQWRAVVALLTDPGRATGPGNAPRWLGSGL